MKLFSKITTAIVGIALAAGVGVAASGNKAKAAGATDEDILKFDFEDDGAHRANTQNSYTTNTYSQHGVDISLSLADSVISGTPIAGSANLMGRIAKDTSGTISMVIGPMDLSAYTVNEVSYYAKGPATGTFTSTYSTDNSSWTQIETHSSTTTATQYKNSSALGVSAPSTFYVKIEITRSGSAKSDFQVDDVVIKGESSSSCEHNWVAGTVHNPTCTEQGYTEYECSLCGETKQDDVTAALGHDFGEWQVVTPATCTTAGSQQRVCSRDSSHTEVEAIPATGHNYVDGVCTVCGAEKPNETVVSTTISDYASANSWENTTKYSSIVLDTNVTVSATGTTNSGKYYAADASWRLYSSESATLEISLSSGSLISATLTFLNTDSPTVQYGGVNVSSGTAVVLSGSSAVFNVTAGKARFTAISVSYSDGSPACEHNWVAGTVHNPTCTEQGYTEYTCSLCSDTKNDDFVAALGHDYGDVIVDTAATCTEAGAGHKVCSRDSSHIENVVIPATGHNFVDGICTVCGAEQPSEVTVGYVFSEHYSANTVIEGDTIEIDSNISIVFVKGSTDTQYYTNGSAVRWYGGGTLTVSSSSGNILSIDIVYSGQHDNAVTADVGTYTDITSASGTGTWTGESSAVVFTQAGTKGHDRISSLSITYDTGSTPPTPVTTYSVTDNVANGSINKSSVNEGATLTTTITPDAKYDLPESVSVTMGGVAIAADYTNGVVTVVNVTDDIVITAECVKKHGLWEDDPYTVAEAMAAIDKETTISGAYVAGIISQVDSFNSKFNSITYWISDDGSTTNHLQVYSGKGIGGAAFSAKEDVEVGATVEVTGNLKKYNSTYEFDYDNYLISYDAPEHPDPTITLSPTKAHLVIGGEGIEVTVSNESFSGTPTISVEGTPSYVNASVSGSKITFTPKAVGHEEIIIKGLYETQEDTETFKVIVTEHAGTDADPFTVAEARDVIDVVETKNASVSGIVSQVDNYADGKITYWISDDGTTENQLQVYKGKGLGGTNFTSKDDVEVGAQVIVNGALKLYDAKYEFDSNNYLVSYVGPTPVVTPELSLSADQGYFGLDGGMSVVASWEGFSADPTLSVEGTPSCVNVSFDDAPQVYFSAKASGTEIVTIKATNGSEVATATFTVVVTEHAGTEADPYSVTDAKLLLIKFDNISGTVKGVISQVVSDSFSAGSASYYISDDGTTTDQLLVTLGKGYGGADFDSIDDVAVGTQVFVGGTLFDGGFASGSSIVSLPNAEAFAQTLLDETDTVCTNSEEPGSAKRKLALKKLWGSTGAVGAGYEALTATEKHALIKSAAKEDGSVVEQAMARYDYLVSAYSLDNIIGRTPSSSLVNTQTISNENSVSTSVATSVVIVVAVISITTLAVLVVVKKRKATSR